jgi:serine/threonine-protein kinase
LELRFTLEEESETSEPEGTIVRQEPAPGQSVAVGTEVRLYIAGPPETVEVPGAIDTPIELARDWMEQAGLQVIEEIIWSTEPISTVIAQVPERGTQVQAGDLVTLTVSGGTSVPIEMNVNLANLILLEQAELRESTFSRGELLSVNLKWKALGNIDEQYVVFVHLIGPAGNLVAQQDVQPVQGTQPTNTWVPDTSRWDLHEFAIPTSAPAGTYQLRTGMYPPAHPENRLPVVDPGEASVDSNSILIAEIIVERP